MQILRPENFIQVQRVFGQPESSALFSKLAGSSSKEDLQVSEREIAIVTRLQKELANYTCKDPYTRKAIVVLDSKLHLLWENLQAFKQFNASQDFFEKKAAEQALNGACEIYSFLKPLIANKPIIVNQTPKSKLSLAVLCGMLMCSLSSDTVNTNAAKPLASEVINQKTESNEGVKPEPVIPEPNMQEPTGTSPGKLPADGEKLFTINDDWSQRHGFYVEDAYGFSGQVRIKSYRDWDRYSYANTHETSISLEAKLGDCKADKTFYLPLKLDQGISSVKCEPECKTSHYGNRLTILEDVKDLKVIAMIQYESKRYEYIYTQPQIELDTYSQKLSSLRTNIAQVHKTPLLKEYLKDFTYIVSNELQELIKKIPGDSAYKTGLIRAADCDGLSDHLAWGLQDKATALVVTGFLNRDADKYLESNERHGQVLIDDRLIETTDKVKNAFIGVKFLADDRETLLEIIADVNKAKNQNDRKELIKKFGDELEKILAKPYYEQFVAKPDRLWNSSPAVVPDFVFPAASILLGILLAALAAKPMAKGLRKIEEARVKKFLGQLYKQLLTVETLKSKESWTAGFLLNRGKKTDWTELRIDNLDLKSVTFLQTVNDIGLEYLAGPCDSRSLRAFINFFGTLVPSCRPQLTKLNESLSTLEKEKNLNEQTLILAVRDCFSSRRLQKAFKKSYPAFIQNALKSLTKEKIKADSNDEDEIHHRVKSPEGNEKNWDGLRRAFPSEALDLRQVNWKATAKQVRTASPVLNQYKYQDDHKLQKVDMAINLDGLNTQEAFNALTQQIHKISTSKKSRLGDVSLYSLGSLQHHIAADKLAKTKNPLVVISTLLNEIAKRKAEYGFFDSVVTEGNQIVKLFEQSVKAHFPHSRPQDLVVFHHQ